MARKSVVPWGAIVSVMAAGVLAAPTLLLPADSPVGPKLVFIVVGSLLFATAVALTRAEPGKRGSRAPDEDDVRP
ncbi:MULTISPECIES: hypothetical protein [Microbacterium]|jgi:hypothetical protein|uniref:hypothetical protein n=1 Tax=Microbacterium TaxID=33882 RepID=UPI001D173C5B|nr:hypothetical protein [Microbacterium testaceum]MCC4248541.1 hypothetical protein [Microbacterium testaceum]